MSFQHAATAAGLLLCALPLTTMAQSTGTSNPPVYEHTIPVQSTAPEQPPQRQDNSDFGLVVDLGLQIGGDRIVRLYFTDGSEEDLYAGDGVSGALGLHYHTAGNWDFRGTFGYKIWDTNAKNAHPYVGRYEAKAVADYFFDNKWFLGGGVVSHSGIKFHGDDIGPNLDFKDATGYTIEAGWRFFALTYAFMDYKDEFGNKYDANNIGISLIGRF